MSNTECDRVKCVHNKMCNYLFELFDAQFTKVIDCNSYEEERPTGKWEWEEEWLPSTTEHPAECQYAEWRCNQCHETPTDNDEWEDEYNKPRLRYCPNCGADMRGEKEE